MQDNNLQRPRKDFLELLRDQYEKVERQTKELSNREFSLVERFVTQSRLARLADRLAVEEQEEALAGRLQAMQLARVTALNEQQIRIKAHLTVLETEMAAEVQARVGEVYGQLFERLIEQDFKTSLAIQEQLDRAEQITNETVKEHHKKRILQFLQQQQDMQSAFERATQHSLERLTEAYQAKAVSYENRERKKR